MAKSALFDDAMPFPEAEILVLEALNTFSAGSTRFYSIVFYLSLCQCCKRKVYTAQYPLQPCWHCLQFLGPGRVDQVFPADWPFHRDIHLDTRTTTERKERKEEYTASYSTLQIYMCVLSGVLAMWGRTVELGLYIFALTHPHRAAVSAMG